MHKVVMQLGSEDAAKIGFEKAKRQLDAIERAAKKLRASAAKGRRDAESKQASGSRQGAETDTANMQMLVDELGGINAAKKALNELRPIIHPPPRRKKKRRRKPS